MKDIPGTENISLKTNGYYYVSRYFDNKTHFVGTGKTLIQALMMRDWAEQNNWNHYPKQTGTNEKYITQVNSGTYCVAKKIKGKTVYYGGFKTLEEAIEYRDFIISKGWSTNYKYKNPMKGLQKHKHGYYVQLYVNGKINYVGNFKTLENAIEVRDLFLKYNGDWDLICEHDSKERAWLNGLKPRNTVFEKVNRGQSDWFRAKRSKMLWFDEEGFDDTLTA